MSASTRPTFSEHDAEPVPGLPGPLPAGETILWQGAPRWGGLARRALHLRGLGVYFFLLAVWRGGALSADGVGVQDALLGALFIIALGAIPLGMLAGFAWLSARTTLYTVTNRRVVVRTGVALPLTVNIPFAVIGSAAVARHGDGTGDIALQVMAPHRISWLALWPHTRSWRITRPEPTLRAVPEPEAVAQLLGRALAAAASMPVRAVPASAAQRPAGQGSAEAMA
ncbi:photosynthetic complex putative assembly protein PuhB [Falsiroseomonas sp.]|uniref:photosynthetic complex putative assembly protein PuhB n=1 Tax=Falsiroseomonas sp. TaxID=2870721 RepID=UPI003568C239